MSTQSREYDQLVAMTDGLFPQFRSRTDAFREACRRRPDLAARAIYPTGEPVVPGAGAGVKPAATRVEDSLLVLAAEKLAGQTRGAIAL